MNKFANEKPLFPTIHFTDKTVIVADSIIVKTPVRKVISGELGTLITAVNSKQAIEQINNLVEQGEMFEVIKLGKDVDEKEIQIGDKVMFFPQSTPRGIYTIYTEEEYEKDGEKLIRTSHDVVMMFSSASVSVIEKV